MLVMPMQDDQKAILDWQQHYDQRLDNFSTRLANMETKFSGELGEMKAMLVNALDNQKGVFTRLNRPVAPMIFGGAAIFLSLATIFFTILSLTVNPIVKALDREIEHSEHVAFAFEERINTLELNGAVSERDRYWLEKMTDRNNHQIDMIWIEMKTHHQPDIDDVTP